MERFLTILASLFFCIGSVYAEGEKKIIPKDNEWEETNERDTSSPQLYQSESSLGSPYKKDTILKCNIFSLQTIII